MRKICFSLDKATHVGLALLFSVLIVSAIAIINPAYAVSGQVGQQQIALNPGGGILPDGSDGLRFIINAALTDYDPEKLYNYINTPGQDSVVYRGTYQYCCSAGAPMLNIGGTLYGQAGPAASGSYGTWTSIDIVSTSGSTAVGALTSAKGNASATILYTRVHDGLTYTVTRVVTYTYPNDYTTDAYTFTIPEGNEDSVKFYLGGDTAPGSSDSGYGVMLTEPVRAVISLNTSSNIMFGFREIPGSKPFDGATSQHFNTPYNTVRSGGNIGFVVTESNHDAGLMMQWNLGSASGTQSASLQQFGTQQGTNLNAAFSSATTTVGVPVQLNISIVNTVLEEADELGYTFTLPSGLVIGSSSPSNSCGGSLNASAGGGSIVLSGGEVGAAANCIVSVPVVSNTGGVYAIFIGNASGLEGLNNNIGTSSLTVSVPGDSDGDGITTEVEDAGPNGGDANDDGTSDSEQSNVTSFVNPETDNYLALVVDEDCDITSASIIGEADLEVADPDFVYQTGFLNFTADCGDNGFTTEVNIYKYGVESEDLVLRKFNPDEETYFTIEDAEIVQEIIDDQVVTIVSYSVTDGEALDIDGLENGIIVDPVGLAGASISEEEEEEEEENVPGNTVTPTPQTSPTIVGVPTTGLPPVNMSVFAGSIFIGIGLLLRNTNAARRFT